MVKFPTKTSLSVEIIIYDKIYAYGNKIVKNISSKIRVVFQAVEKFQTVMEFRAFEVFVKRHAGHDQREGVSLSDSRSSVAQCKQVYLLLLTHMTCMSYSKQTQRSSLASDLSSIASDNFQSLDLEDTLSCA